MKHDENLQDKIPNSSYKKGKLSFKIKTTMINERRKDTHTYDPYE